eukprot:scaffold407838_cov52-Prasinocladus_malaysianus.AAC.1
MAMLLLAFIEPRCYVNDDDDLPYDSCMSMKDYPYKQAILMGCTRELLEQYFSLKRFTIQASTPILILVHIDNLGDDLHMICNPSTPTALLVLSKDDGHLYGLWEAVGPEVGLCMPEQSAQYVVMRYK